MQDEFYSFLGLNSPVEYNLYDYPQMMGMQSLVPNQLLPLSFDLPLVQELSTSPTEIICEQVRESSPKEPEPDIPSSLQKTRRKHLTNQCFTDLISNLTAMYWSTTLDPIDYEDQHRQEKTMTQLVLLSKDIKETMETNKIRNDKLKAFATQYEEIATHLNPYIIQTFLATQTMRAVQRMKSKKRQHYATKPKESSKKISTNDGEYHTRPHV